jgi:chaperone required for assembly of F1-ATPase
MPASPSDPPRRFYKDVEARPLDAGGRVLTLDGRIAKTPGGAALIVPSAEHGALLAEEWRAQGDRIRFADMPATRLAFTAIDRTGQARNAVVEEIVRFASSDLICYFAEAPAALVERQDAAWGPWLAWADQALGVCLNRATGVSHRPQSPDTLNRVRALAAAEDDFQLTGLAFATALYGSAVLALAVRRAALAAEAAFDLSRLDDYFQQERWGEDAEAAAGRAALRREAEVLGRWLRPG